MRRTRWAELRRELQLAGMATEAVDELTRPLNEERREVREVENQLVEDESGRPALSLRPHARYFRSPPGTLARLARQAGSKAAIKARRGATPARLVRDDGL